MRPFGCGRGYSFDLPGRLRLGRRGLACEKTRFAPAIDVNAQRQPQAAQQIGAQHVTKPMRAQVDAREADGGEKKAQYENHSRAPPDSFFQERIGQKNQEAKESCKEDDMAAGKTIAV